MNLDIDDDKMSDWITHIHTELIATELINAS